MSRLCHLGVDASPGARLGAAGVSVDGDLLLLHHGVQHLGDELAGQLPLPEHVHGVHHHDGHLVSVLIGHGKLLSSSLNDTQYDIQKMRRHTMSAHLGRGVGVTRVVSVILLVSHAMGGRAEHLGCGQVDKPLCR